jgi:sugar phosphate isomerase/epimerase
MRIGLMSVCAADLEIDGVAAVAKEFGLEGLELAAGYLGKFRGEPEGKEWHIDTEDLLASAERAALAARAAGLEIFSFASHCAADDLDRFESLCRAAGSIGCPQVRLGVGGYDAALGFWGSIDRARDQLSQAVERAREYNVRTVIELHDNTMADGVLASYYLVRDMDPGEVGVIFDAGNARVFGYQPWPEALDILYDFIAHVHVKDLTWIRKGDERVVDFVGPDEGLTEWPELLRLLAARGYDGWLSIEDYRGGWCRKNPQWPTRKKVGEWKSYLDGIIAKL